MRSSISGMFNGTSAILNLPVQLGAALRSTAGGSDRAA
jgi:hypothetical protein